MKERLYFDISADSKKELLEGLKNELKLKKKIIIFDEYGETIGKCSKYDVYSTHIDFNLDDPIQDFITKEPGKIQSIILKEEENSKGCKVLRVKSITA